MATRFSTQLRISGGYLESGVSGMTRQPTALDLGGKIRVVCFDVLTAAAVSPQATPWLSGETLVGMELQADNFRSLGGVIILSGTLGAGRTVSVDLVGRNAAGLLAVTDSGFFGTALAVTGAAEIPFGRTTALHFLEKLTLPHGRFLGLTLAGGDAAAGVTMRTIYQHVQD